MAKRYHQSAGDRLAESRGEERHLYRKMMNDGDYAGEAARRRQEMYDAGMIREDHSAIANLPQNVMIKDWPKGGYGMEKYLDDSISGVDRQMDADDNKRSAHNKPHKF